MIGIFNQHDVSKLMKVQEMSSSWTRMLYKHSDHCTVYISSKSCGDIKKKVHMCKLCAGSDCNTFPIPHLKKPSISAD